MEDLHIGLSAAGWCFALHVTSSIRSLSDWKILFEKKNQWIADESGKVLDASRMLSIITERSMPSAPLVTAAFHEKNHSEDGPNNLHRFKVGEANCIGHGEGTWDLVEGEFA